jgi:hypothetical protein
VNQRKHNESPEDVAFRLRETKEYEKTSNHRFPKPLPPVRQAQQNPANPLASYHLRLQSISPDFSVSLLLTAL